ncbi:antitoxin [Archaeoglobales archaeon]|nr:MAG: antitoxin [Archaeoglobales archaeon]
MKTISIRDDVYKKLVEMKEGRESFSDVIEKLLKKKNTNIKRYFGVLKDSEVLDEIERCLEARKTARFRV